MSNRPFPPTRTIGSRSRWVLHVERPGTGRMRSRAGIARHHNPATSRKRRSLGARRNRRFTVGHRAEILQGNRQTDRPLGTRDGASSGAAERIGLVAAVHAQCHIYGRQLARPRRHSSRAPSVIGLSPAMSVPNIEKRVDREWPAEAGIRRCPTEMASPSPTGYLGRCGAGTCQGVATVPTRSWPRPRVVKRAPDRG